jgi:hypothetical protein
MQQTNNKQHSQPLNFKKKSVLLKAAVLERGLARAV